MTSEEARTLARDIRAHEGSTVTTAARVQTDGSYVVIVGFVSTLGSVIVTSREHAETLGLVA